MAQTAVLDANVPGAFGSQTGPGIFQPITFSDTTDLTTAVRVFVAGAAGDVKFLRWNPSAGKADDTADAMTLTVSAGQKVDIGYVRRFLSTGTATAIKAAGGLVGAS